MARALVNRATSAYDRSILSYRAGDSIIIHAQVCMWFYLIVCGVLFSLEYHSLFCYFIAVVAVVVAFLL